MVSQRVIIQGLFGKSFRKFFIAGSIRHNKIGSFHLAGKLAAQIEADSVEILQVLTDKALAKEMGFDSLGYQSLDGLLEAIGLDRDKICTYCWTGKE